MAGEQTTTRAQLRTRVAGLMGDLLSLVATSAGTTTQFQDSIRLSSGIINPRNREIVFTSGTNLGLSRRITDSDVTTGQISFDAVTAATAANDTAEIYSNNGKGFVKDDYDRALLMAQDDAWPGYQIPMSVSVVAVFDQTTGLMTVPASITHISRVAYVDTNNIEQMVPKANGWGNGWRLDPATGFIDVRGDSLLSVMDGQVVKLYGGAREASFTADDSTTGIDPQWLVFQAAGHLCMQGYHKGETAMYNTALYYYDKADRIIPISRHSRQAVRVL